MTGVQNREIMKQENNKTVTAAIISHISRFRASHKSSYRKNLTVKIYFKIGSDNISQRQLIELPHIRVDNTSPRECELLNKILSARCRIPLYKLIVRDYPKASKQYR